MPTPTATKLPVKPKPAPTPLHDRLAADLRALADIATSNPDLAELLASAVKDLHVVVRISSDVRSYQVTDAAIAAGATELAHQVLDPYWATSGVTLPAGLVRLTVTQLSPPALDDAPTGQA